ncbi:DUF6508 domain-containing protein [Hyphomicrobium sp. DY-1]|uniref:DUF6508 domain-containing protein n=1 Tax=Hyphomicrobium sp. DY-1 TaxID=3075650 RepID=UPI0039C29E60
MAAYLPVLQSPDFWPGEFRPAQKTETGSIIMPYAVLGDIADAFVSAAYDRGWVQCGFDWASWAHSDEAQKLCNDPSALAQAEPLQLVYLITVVCRQDRFRDGTLLSAFKSFLILGIVRRAAAIVEDERCRLQS